MIIHNNQHEGFYQKFSRQAFAWGQLLKGKIVEFVPSVGILIVKSCEKAININT